MRRGGDRTSIPRYSSAAIAAHWGAAVLIAVLFGLGWYMVGIARGTPARGYFFNLHKSIGIVAGIFIALQLGLRLRHAAPPLPEALPAWQMKATEVGHVLLYVCVVVMVISGYVESNFTKFGVRFFGYQLPPWGWEDRAISASLVRAHLYTSYVLIALIVGHVAAALYHLLRQDRVIERMLPGN